MPEAKNLSSGLMHRIARAFIAGNCDKNSISCAGSYNKAPGIVVAVLSWRVVLFLQVPSVLCFMFGFFCLFDSLHPINNLSVIKGQVFLG